MGAKAPSTERDSEFLRTRVKHSGLVLDRTCFVAQGTRARACSGPLCGCSCLQLLIPHPHLLPAANPVPVRRRWMEPRGPTEPYGENLWCTQGSVTLGKPTAILGLRLFL